MFCHSPHLTHTTSRQLNHKPLTPQKTEVVPLYGDMMIGPFKYIENTPNYDPFKWGHSTSKDPSGQAELEPKYLLAIRHEHIKLVSDLTYQCKVRGQLNAINKKVGPGPA